MKGFAVVLLCALAAAQGYDTAVRSAASGRTLAALGENPWLVHIRMARHYTGLLKTCAGVLIDAGWVLSSASCLNDYRFIWVRYGTIDVIHPTFVSENSAVTIHPQYHEVRGENDIGLIRINRIMRDVEYVAPIPMMRDPTAPLPATGKLCAFGANKMGAPSDYLSCFEVQLQKHGDHIVANSVDGLQTTDYDFGAPLVSNGVLLGIRNNWLLGESAGYFLNPANYIEWISAVSEVQF